MVLKARLGQWKFRSWQCERCRVARYHVTTTTHWRHLMKQTVHAREAKLVYGNLLNDYFPYALTGDDAYRESAYVNHKTRAHFIDTLF